MVTPTYQELVELVAVQAELITSLTAQVQALQAEVAELKRRSGADSSNSSRANDFVALVHGSVNGKALTLSIEIGGDDAAYQHPGTRHALLIGNFGGGAQLQIVGDVTPRYHTPGPLGEEEYILLNADRKSGAIAAWFDDPDDSQNSAHDVIHVEGAWRCG